jgi:hypothetical protein
MNPWIQMLVDMIDNAASWLAFAYMLLGGVIVVMLIALFGALAIRGAWRWLTGHSWNSAIAAAERKAFRWNHR